MQQLSEGQLVGRMLLWRLATGATGVKQARYRRGGSARHSYAHAQYIHNASDASVYCVCMCVAAVECETDEFRRGFCTLVPSRASASKVRIVYTRCAYHFAL